MKKIILLLIFTLFFSNCSDLDEDYRYLYDEKHTSLMCELTSLDSYSYNQKRDLNPDGSANYEFHSVTFYTKGDENRRIKFYNGKENILTDPKLNWSYWSTNEVVNNSDEIVLFFKDLLDKKFEESLKSGYLSRCAVSQKSWEDDCMYWVKDSLPISSHFYQASSQLFHQGEGNIGTGRLSTIFLEITEDDFDEYDCWLMNKKNSNKSNSTVKECNKVKHVRNTYPFYSHHIYPFEHWNQRFADLDNGKELRATDDDIKGSHWTLSRKDLILENWKGESSYSSYIERYLCQVIEESLSDELIKKLIPIKEEITSYQISSKFSSKYEDKKQQEAKLKEENLKKNKI